MAVNGERDGVPDPAQALIARLYRDAAREEPPSHLDRVIAAAARERPAGSLPGARNPWWTPWRVPFAVAALAVVSTGLITLMMEKDPERIAAEAPSRPLATPPEPARSDADRSQASDGGERSAPPRKPPPERPRAAEAPREAREQAARDASPPRAEAHSSRGAEAPAHSPAPMLPSVSESAPAETLSRAPARESAQARPATGAAPTIARHLAELTGQPPGAWIERVIALRKEGRAAEAGELLAELKRRHPDAALPPELR